MDKRETLKEIAKELLKQKLDSKNIIDGRDLDRIIYEKSNKIDKNIKYEFRNLLWVFDLIQQYKSPEIRQNDAFIVEKKIIQTFLGVKE